MVVSRSQKAQARAIAAAKRRRQQVGVLERRNPLPRARYWVHVIGEDQAALLKSWLAEHAADLILEKVDDTPVAPTEMFTLFGTPALFAIFTVVKPVIFPQTKLGFPNIATKKIESRADVEMSEAETKQRGKEAAARDIEQATAAVTQWGSGIGLILLALGAAWLLKNWRS